MVVGRQSINTNNSLFDWISMDAMNSLNESSLVSTGGSGGEEEAAALDSLSTNTNNTNLQLAVSNSTSGAPPTTVYDGIDEFMGSEDVNNDTNIVIITKVLNRHEILHGLNCCSEEGCTNRPLFHYVADDDLNTTQHSCLQHFLDEFGCVFHVVGDNSLACVPVGSAYLETILRYCTNNSRSIIPHFLLFDASESVQKRPRVLPSIPS